VLLVLAVLTWIILVWREISPPVKVNVTVEVPRNLVFCPAGTFRRLAPPHDLVQVREFYIDRIEVRESDYADFLLANPKHPKPPHWVDRTGVESDRDLPMTWVSLIDARAYAAWLGKRLPTSDEWEWAAVGDLKLPYPWGRLSGLPKANTLELGLGRRTPAGLFFEGASPFGALDMVGNVREWTETRSEGFDELYFLRGGSYVEPLTTADRRTVMDTHISFTREDIVYEVDPVTQTREPVTQLIRETKPLPEYLSGPKARSAQWGFRCVMEVEEYARREDRRHYLADQISRLGAKDPLSYLFETLPAMRVLKAAGAEARPLIEECLKNRQDDAVRSRLESLLPKRSS
jgi:hypothetical protein